MYHTHQHDNLFKKSDVLDKYEDKQRDFALSDHKRFCLFMQYLSGIVWELYGFSNLERGNAIYSGGQKTHKIFSHSLSSFHARFTLAHLSMC
jgi:hypothetical protein